MTLNKAARQLRDEGRCVQCGEPLTPEEKLSRYIRCRCCRGVPRDRVILPQKEEQPAKPNICLQNTAVQRENEVRTKARVTADEIIERRKQREAQLARCLHCAYGTLAGGGIIFCPVPVCWHDYKIPKVREVV